MKRLLDKSRGIRNILKVYWRHILAASLFLLIIAVVYWRDLEILANEALSTEALSHVLLIPLFVGLLLYWKRDAFKASVALDSLRKKSESMFFDELVGLSLCLIAFLVYWYGSYTFYPLEYHMLSLPIFVAGVILVLFNLKALKALIIPVALLVFLVPIPNEITYTLGGNLANFNTQASYTILKGFGVPVTLNATYGSPTIMLTKSSAQPVSFTVDIPCSGIYMLTAFFMFAVFLAAIVQASVPKKLWIFTFGFAIFEVLNIIRITAIVSAAYIFGEEIAMLIFHSVAGLVLTFTGIFITLIVSEKLLKIKIAAGKTEEAPLCPECKRFQMKFQNFCLNCGRFFNPFKRKPSRIFWAKLTLLLVGCCLISLSVNAPVFAISKETMEVTSWEKTTGILPQFPEYRLAFLYRDTDYERIAKQDAALVYAYFPANLSNPVTYALVSVANSISNLHNWEVCLISWQTTHGRYPLVEVLASEDILLLGGNQLIARYLVFRNPEENYTQLTLYWYEKATFKMGATVQQRYVRISLVMLLVRSVLSYRQYEDQLLELGEAVARHWEPMKTQSLFSLGIPAQQTLLVFSIAFMTVAKAAQSTNEWRKRMNNLKIFNNLASPMDKLILQTIIELSKTKGTATTAEINLAIKNKTGKTVRLERLVERLNHLQDYGFIKRDMVFIDGKPFLIWRSLVNF
ncbi:MAG: exosortase/archaeosortase family protein [Candidatus Bathyarchaeota archaeon]|nr:exosortase/archaeosortase family protein [Candidatus Bathyarchaeota archaeon]